MSAYDVCEGSSEKPLLVFARYSVYPWTLTLGPRLSVKGALQGAVGGLQGAGPAALCVLLGCTQHQPARAGLHKSTDCELRC